MVYLYIFTKLLDKLLTIKNTYSLILSQITSYVNVLEPYEGTLLFDNDFSIEIRHYPIANDIYMQLKYDVIDNNDEVRTITRLIYIIQRPSNLKSGTLLYLGCPHSGKAVRTLYFDQKDGEFKSMFAFNLVKRRLYYPSQAYSGLTMLGEKEKALISKLNKEYSKRNQEFYNDIPTKRSKRIEKLELALDEVRKDLIFSFFVYLCGSSCSLCN